MSAMGNSRFMRVMNRERQRERKAEEEDRRLQEQERRHQDEKRDLQWQLLQSQYQWQMAMSQQSARWLGVAPQMVHVQGGRLCAFILSMQNIT